MCSRPRHGSPAGASAVCRARTCARSTRRRPSPRWWRSSSTFALFLLDGFVAPSLLGALVPFASPTMPFAVGLGQLAASGMVALGLAYYARGRIGPARFRRAHRFVGGFWLLAVLHTVLAGSDAGRVWFLAVALSPAALAAGLLALRWWPAGQERPASAGRAGPAG